MLHCRFNFFRLAFAKCFQKQFGVLPKEFVRQSETNNYKIKVASIFAQD